MMLARVFIDGKAPRYALSLTEAELTAEVLGAGTVDSACHIVCDYKMYRHAYGEGWKQTSERVTSVVYGGLNPMTGEYE